MRRTAGNVSGLTHNDLIKLHIKNCSMLWFSKHPHYHPFSTRCITVIILSCPVSIHVMDRKERTKHTL